VHGAAAIEVGATGIVGGADVEPDGDPYTTDLATFRGRILFRKRNPPQGGSAADYVMWGTELSGVTRVYVERAWSGPGTVRVFPVFDEEFAAAGGIAPAERIKDVRDHIAAYAPASAAITVSAPTSLPIDVEIVGLTPDITSVREAVLAELRATFRRKGRVAGADIPVQSMPYLATPLNWSRSWIWQAVANATGEEAHGILQPASDVTIPAGFIPVLGTVTFS